MIGMVVVWSGFEVILLEVSSYRWIGYDFDDTECQGLDNAVGV